MDNAFFKLGLEPQLDISDEILRERFRAAGKSQHPDAGGGAGEFAGLREAMAILSSPSRRLRHWLELRGLPADPRGAIDNRLMEIFGEIGGTCQAADALARRREEAGSALVRALMEEETQRCRERVEAAISTVDAALRHEVSHFRAIAEAAHPEPAKVARNLAFLEKWQASLKARFASLI
jgi:hypothetical protein